MDPSKLMEFSKLIGVLKHLPRTGWVRTGVSSPETVSGHMYRMAIFAFCLDKDKVDRDRCIKMALVHDMAESIVGDISPLCDVSEEEKHKREEDAMNHIATLVPEEVGKEFVALWKEYEAQSSPEAKAVKDLDKFDMLAQAYEYEKDSSQPDKLQEFFNSTPMAMFSTPDVQDWVKTLAEYRFELRKGQGKVIGISN